MQAIILISLGEYYLLGPWGSSSGTILGETRLLSFFLLWFDYRLVAYGLDIWATDDNEEVGIEIVAVF